MPCMPCMPPCISFIIAMPSCMAFMCSAIRACRSAGVWAFIILVCMSCMAFMRGGMSAMDMAAVGAPMPGMAERELMGSGLAQAVARAARDKAMRLRVRFMNFSWSWLGSDGPNGADERWPCPCHGTKGACQPATGSTSLTLRKQSAVVCSTAHIGSRFRARRCAWAHPLKRASQPGACAKAIRQRPRSRRSSAPASTAGSRQRRRNRAR